MDFGLPELLIILVLVLLLFGSSRLPKLSRSMGEALKELRNGLTGTGSTPTNNNTEEKEKSETSETKA